MTHTVMYTQDNTKFLTGDVVFVKVKGYPEWPALVNEIDKTTKTPKYKVTCFGTKDIVKARETDIWLCAENIHKYGLNTQSTRNNKFNQGLIEAEEYYLENIQSKEETGNALKTDRIKNHCCIDETPKEIQVHTSNEPLEELKRSLLQNDLQDDENNLQMAAKIEAMLLEKNNLLKDENLKLKMQLTSLEGIIEEHEHKEENYILKIENLQDKVERIVEQLKTQPQPQTVDSLKTSNNYVHNSDRLFTSSKSYAKNQSVEVTLENSYSKVKWNKKPPINAKVKLKEESYEPFFVKHIGFYKECMTKGYTRKEALSDSLLVNGVPPVPTSTHQLLTQQPKTQDSISLHIETKNTVITEHSGPLIKTNSNFL
ncbi:PC4 and SFRS1-interacting protein [Homalodisca vitripennis]|nr:PC4 and SFRS1-interacting protein [Homalodisca vitripennis]